MPTETPRFGRLREIEVWIALAVESVPKSGSVFRLELPAG